MEAFEAVRNDLPSGGVQGAAAKAETPVTAETAKNAKSAQNIDKAAESGFPQDRQTVSKLVKQTSELMSAFDRQLKYEMKDEAGVVQIQVIDSRDGRVVRKIPADEVIKFLEQIKTQVDDRVDVLA